MAALSILEYPDYRLRIAAAPVETFDAELGRLVDTLCQTMREESLIGLSATQLDIRQRIAVITPENPEAPQVYINPEIVSRRGLGFVEESCRSVPGVKGNVMRAMRIRVEAQDRDGTPFTQDLEGMDAVCLQHELDHLNGKLFIDRLFILRRLMIGFGAIGKKRREVHDREHAA
ncbi:peptide deformylase [Rhodovibrio salinarum]|uniref:Peptide deformylase n=1 Tax=Rhodovibrio salinarum TaxID=1087 RepID=A0A934QKP6_9PROT|nr:peptide deformylase [Rhodovibrio salinarum]MBK1698658.1 peptide deformylase [Rhodovibrio salinarum]